MDLMLKTILVIVLILIVYQDMKMRLIHILLPVALFGLGMVMNWFFVDYAYMEWLWSLLFLGLNFLVVTLYFSVKKRSYTNPIDTLIGWGDVLFLIALIPFFSFRGYLQFFVMGMIFSLLLFVVMKAIYPKYRTIPLAGFLALFLMGTMLVDGVTDIDLLL
ncbi:hypothetical protein SAMN06265377_3538 [Flagellimonas pacifica]|uniref:Prepilin type IV endopeptidase peptidase domain-containing protein n=2 Tax=Flagellimonas pacifica TaxID=1247520 RepID=A0A285N112_9FLAO|nr:hypothetical protein SAMN06265377_3538 [Allomuricauda parva]